jgi:hypothetical protein
VTLIAGVWNLLEGNGILHSRYSCWRIVYLREFEGCDWPDLARIIPRAKGAQSNWQETVTLGCPR